MGGQSPATGGIAEDVPHGSLEEGEAGGTAVSSCLGLDGFPGMFEGVGVHIDESKIDVGADGGLGDEVGDLPGGAAADIIDLGAATEAGGVGGGIDERLGEEFDAGTVSAGGGLLEEPDVEYLGEEGGAAAGVAEHHVDHGVIAGIAEWFGVGAVGERCGQDPGVESLLAILAVEGDFLAWEGPEVLFESFEEIIECSGGLGGDGSSHVASPCRVALGGWAGGCEFHLVCPALEVGEERHEIGHDDLELGGDAPVFLAIFQEAPEQCVVGFFA